MARTLSSALLLVVLGGCAAPPARAPELRAPLPPALPHGGERVTRKAVLVGPGGLQITLLELEGKRTLLQLRGTAGALEGLVLEHRQELAWNRLRYLTTVDGSDWVTLARDVRSGATAAFPLELDGRGVQVTVNETRSAAVQAESLLRLHREQLGRIARLRHFDRARRQREIEARIRENLQSALKVCGARARLEVSWQGVAAATLSQLRPNDAHGCGEVLHQLRNVCRDESPRAYLRGIDTVRCRFGATVAARRLGATLELTAILQSHGDNQQRGFEALLGLPSTGGKPLAELIRLDHTDVCLADGGRAIIIGPPGAPYWGVSYGDGKTFTNDGSRYRPSRGWFFDPRHLNKENNEQRRGLGDLRNHSHVDVDRGRQTCSLTCGHRVTPLKLASRAETVATVERAVFKPRPHQRAPYALARDRAGVYYYVDRSTEAGRERDFRVFRGPRGKVRPLRMKDIVSDSEGDIFATRDGKLRLLLSSSEAQWVRGARSQPLVVLPVAENFSLIYTELGVYLGERLGLPCDDL